MRIAKGVVVMVVDGAKMLLFRNDGTYQSPALTTLAHREIDNPASSAQGTDTPGRTRARVGERRSGYEETNWHQQAEDRFAAEAAAALEQALVQEKGGAVVVAPPRTLAVLRKHYGSETKARLLGEIAKDLVHHVTGDIIETLTAHE